MTFRSLCFFAGGSDGIETDKSVKTLGRSNHHSADAERHKSAGPAVFHGIWDILGCNGPV